MEDKYFNKEGSIEDGSIKFNMFDKELNFNAEEFKWDETDYSFKKIEATVDDMHLLDILQLEKPKMEISKKSGSPDIEKDISSDSVKFQTDNVFYNGSIQITDRQNEWNFITDNSTIEVALSQSGELNNVFLLESYNFSS